MTEWRIVYTDVYGGRRDAPVRDLVDVEIPQHQLELRDGQRAALGGVGGAQGQHQALAVGAEPLPDVGGVVDGGPGGIHRLATTKAATNQACSIQTIEPIFKTTTTSLEISED